MHGREKRGVIKPSVDDIYDEVSRFYEDEIKTELLSPKGSQARLHWLDWTEQQLMSASNSNVLTDERIEHFLDIMLCCLTEDKGEVPHRALRVMVLSYLWCMNTNTGERILSTFKEPAFAVQCSTIREKINWISYNTVLLLTSKESAGEYSFFIKAHLYPIIEEFVAKIYKTETEEEDEDTLAQKKNHLIESINSLLSLISLMDDAETQVPLINEVTDFFTQLLMYNDIDIVMLAAEALVVVTNVMSHYSNVDGFTVNLTEVCKEIRQAIHNNEMQLTRDQTNTLNKYVEMIETNEYTSLVEAITVANTLENARINIRDRLLLEKYRNKKGHPASGYCEARVIEYLKQKIGHVFSELSNYELMTADLKSTTGFSNYLDDIIGRSHVAISYSTKVENLKNFGSALPQHKTNEETEEVVAP